MGAKHCEPITCPLAGTYPDPDFGNVCQTCTDLGESVGGLTLPGVLGVSACICPTGYFWRKSTSNPTKRIHCWPCGDLGCDANLERQTTCTGRLSEEPTCVCASGPGMVQQQCSTAAQQCGPGYIANPAANPYGLHDQYSFFASSASSILLSTTVLPTVLMGRTDLCSVVLQGQLVLVLSEGGLFVLDGQSAASVPVPNIFQVGYRTSGLTIHGIVGHSVSRELVWVLLSYTGLCLGDDQNDHSYCWAIDLIRVQTTPKIPTTANCILSMMLCITMEPNNLGFDTSVFPIVEGLTLGRDGVSLLLICNQTRVYRYSTTTQPSGELIFSSDTVIRGVVDGGRGLYVLDYRGKLQFQTTNNFLLSTTNKSFSDVQSTTSPWLLMVRDETSLEWLQVDVWNQFVSPPFLSHTYGLVTLQHDTLVYSDGSRLQHLSGVRACPTDTYYVLSSCQAMPCLASEPCGPHSLRPNGASACICQPGFYYYANQEGCLPCPSSSFYCPGNVEPQRCPDHAFTGASSSSSSISDCLCEPHFYHFETLCLGCPVGFWCPFAGTYLPIQCKSAGLTQLEGSISPLDCNCPPRTHGLTCEPCSDTEDCTLSESQVVMELSIKGWAPSWGEETLRGCLQPHTFVIYSVFGMTEINSMAAMSTPDQLLWYWYVLVQPSSSSVVQNLLVGNISDCLTRVAFPNIEIIVHSTKTRPVPTAQPYERRYEWDGNMDTPGETCIAGYEELAIQSFNLQLHCFPCLNGTKRPRRDPDRRCTPCTFGHAPYLGMTECVCLAGYNLAVDGNSCEPTVMVRIVPWWYSVAFAAPIYTSSAVAGFGLLVILFSVAIVHFC